MQMFKRFLAEFFGTMMLVVFACGTAVVTGCTAAADGAYILTALAFGLVLLVLAYAIGHVSGCHINPAVSLGKFLTGALSGWDFLGYVVSQCLGGIAGGAVLYGLLGTERGLGQNGLYDASAWKSILIEAILTMLFVFVVLAVTSKKEYSAVAGLCVGFALTLVHIFGIFFTGTSVNPARSLGVALFVGGAALENVWVFIAGPFLGAIVAALLWYLFCLEPVEKKPAAEASEESEAK